MTSYNPERHPAQPTRHLSLACSHCATPACALACPARAYRRDDATGALLLDETRCIGCRYCSWVCPYDAPRFDPSRGVMAKCTFCTHRLTAGLEPACVTGCPTGALRTGERPDPPREPRFHGLGHWDLGPALVVVPPRRDAPPPGGPEAEDLPPPLPPPVAARITLRSEAGLLLFTVVVPVLVGWFAAGLRRPDRAPSPALFVAALAVAFAASSHHLGRPLRAWRAVLGLRTSWLSREIVAAVAFAVLGVGALTVPGTAPVAAGAAATAGLFAVVAIDLVYRAIPRDSTRTLHGAEATVACALLAGIIGGLPWLAVAAAGLTAAAVALRWRDGALGMPPAIGVLRLALLGSALAPWPWWLAATQAVVATAVDRAAFYATLEPSSPASRMTRELQRALVAHVGRHA